MRYDKYDPKSGGFRAPLKVALVLANGYTAYGVAIDSTGAVVLGTAAGTGIVGVFIGHGARAAGEIVDVMTSGECVEAGLAAGTKYTANTTTGVITSAAASGTQIAVGYTVEADRLVVRADGRN